MISHSLFSDTLASEEGADNVRVMPLSEIQQRVALLLATGHTAREVAQKMGLSEVTIHRWRQQPEFVAYRPWHTKTEQTSVKRTIE
uniref:Helix-turn-helix domain-containing protein n=1 Tax=Desertifilum tharense IPPAS B-1220 TaxID=1781255 RepID=A0ACD5GVM4_9CYAN